MKNEENLKIQIRVSNTIAGIGFFVVAANILRFHFLLNKDFMDILLHETEIPLVFVFSLIMFLSRKSKRKYVQYLQLIVFLANAALALLDEYDAFHGMGFIILTILLAYRYGMLEKYTRIKLIFIAVFTLFFLEFSIRNTEDNLIGSSLFIILYLVFFLSLIYLIYKSEINHLLNFEKVYHETVTSMEYEKSILLKEIEGHAEEIQKKESRISELEVEILKSEYSGQPINLKEDYSITNREEDVIREFCLNPHLTTKELASHMNMSLGTIKQHFNSIFRKLKVRSRSELLDKCKWNFRQELETASDR